MEIKLGVIVDAKASLEKIAKEEFPASIAYRIGKNVRAVNVELVSFEEARAKLVEKYGEKLEDGGWKVKPAYISDFVAEIRDLLATEVEVEIYQIDLAKYPKDISPLDLEALSFMFTESE